MNETPTLALAKIRELAAARHVTLAGLVLAAIVVQQFLGTPSPLPSMVIVILALGAFDALVLVRLRSGAAATRHEALGHFGFDIAALSLFFWSSGGASNPFIDLFLVPLAAAALRFSRGEMLAAVAASLAAYLTLVAWHVPLPVPAEGMTSFHCFGVWLNYAVCGGFVAYAIHGLAMRSREDERRLAAAQQRNESDDYLARAGALALGAAHDIRTPLCTIDVLVNEVLYSRSDAAAATKNLRLAARQLEGCRRILGELVTYGRDAPGQVPGLPVDRFLHELVDTWRVLRPSARLVCHRSGARPVPSVARASGLGHAILNLLSNAADASPGSVTLECQWTVAALHVQVLDRGPGLPEALREVLGERPVTKPGHGAGIGLLLTRRIVERAGGKLELSPREGGGTTAELTVPLIPAEPSAAGAAAPTPFHIRYYGSGT